MAEHDLPLRRLAEEAHVRDAAVRDEVARARRVAAVLGADRVALLRLLDLAADGRDEHVPAEPHAGVLQRSHRLDVAGERALHVRDAEPVEAAVLDECLGLEPRTPASHGSCPEYDVSMWPLNMRLLPPPAPSQTPRAFARSSSTCCHWQRRPISSKSSRMSSAIACSLPVKLQVPTMRLAVSTTARGRRRPSRGSRLLQLERDVDLGDDLVLAGLERHR